LEEEMTTIRKIIPLAFAALAIFGGAAPAHAIPPKFQGEWAIPAGKFLEGRFPLARQVKQFAPEAVAGWGGTFEVGNRDIAWVDHTGGRIDCKIEADYEIRAPAQSHNTWIANLHCGRARQGPPAKPSADNPRWREDYMTIRLDRETIKAQDGEKIEMLKVTNMKTTDYHTSFIEGVRRQLEMEKLYNEPPP
jgi:hypothetical protein